MVQDYDTGMTGNIIQLQGWHVFTTKWRHTWEARTVTYSSILGLPVTHGQDLSVFRVLLLHMSHEFCVQFCVTRDLFTELDMFKPACSKYESLNKLNRFGQHTVAG